MKKFVTIISIALILLVVGYFIGIYTFVNGNIASVIIKNQTERSIMTATINHESGSIIAANIKKVILKGPDLSPMAEKHILLKSPSMTTEQFILILIEPLKTVILLLKLLQIQV